MIDLKSYLTDQSVQRDSLSLGIFFGEMFNWFNIDDDIPKTFLEEKNIDVHQKKITFVFLLEEKETSFDGEHFCLIYSMKISKSVIKFISFLSLFLSIEQNNFLIGQFLDQWQIDIFPLNFFNVAN